MVQLERLNTESLIPPQYNTISDSKLKDKSVEKKLNIQNQLKDMLLKSETQKSLQKKDNSNESEENISNRMFQFLQKYGSAAPATSDPENNAQILNSQNT